MSTMLLMGRIPARRSRICIQKGAGPTFTPRMKAAE